MMVAEPVTNDYAASAADRMAALVRDGIKVADAALVVRDEMLRDGSAWELFVQHGEWLVQEAWRRSGGVPREPTPIRYGSAPGPRRAAVADTQIDEAEDAADYAAGDIDAADSIYRAPFKIDGEWTTLGSLSRVQCRTLQFFFENRSEDARKKARFFKKLADALGEDQQVRKRWSEYQLRTMYAELGA